MSGYKGHLTGKTYESEEAMRHYESIEARRRCVPSAEEQAFDNLPAEKIRELFEKASRGEQLKAAQVQSRVDLQAFLRAYPEYQDCTENSGRMKYFLKGMGVDTRNGVVTFHNLEQAYLALKDDLKLKASAVKRLQAEAVNDRLTEIERERSDFEFDESDAYDNLSMDELRQRASRQLSGETTQPLNSAVPDALGDPQRHLTPGSGVNRRGFAESNRL